MILGLIGMSGVGKTSWANKLAGAGFTCLHCDDLIAAKLRTHCGIAADSLYDVGHWMGFPSEPHYIEREAIYLGYEGDVLREIAHSIARGATPTKRLVIDMTGSAMYIDPDILEAIHRVATIVYLAASPVRREQMVRTYLARPRPVVWHGLYQPLPHELPAEALARGYKELITVREGLYEAFCDVRIDQEIYSQPAFTVQDFLRSIDQARSQGV